MGDAAEAQVALGRRRLATAQAHRARAAGRSTDIYVAPTRASWRCGSTRRRRPRPRAPRLRRTWTRCPSASRGLSVRSWRRIVGRALLSTAAMTFGDDPNAAARRVDQLLDAASGADGGDGVLANSPEARRDALWSEFRRHVGISQDRLWVFLRLLSGTVGGDVNEVITMADEATLRATRRCRTSGCRLPSA